MIEILKISLIAFMFSALTQDEHTLLSWYGKLLNKLPWWLCKPLGGCYRCFVGQVCLWYLLLSHNFHSFEILFLTSFGIMVSMIYNKIYCLLK
jgi:hypothetical protein